VLKTDGQIEGAIDVERVRALAEAVASFRPSG